MLDLDFLDFLDFLDLLDFVFVFDFSMSGPA
jgi:hypothetical protein